MANNLLGSTEVGRCYYLLVISISYYMVVEGGAQDNHVIIVLFNLFVCLLFSGYWESAREGINPVFRVPSLGLSRVHSRDHPPRIARVGRKLSLWAWKAFYGTPNFEYFSGGPVRNDN